ncbi:hypothetical protein YC2023_067319 [Brassica napus]
MEYKGKVKTANEIFNLGISRNAKPVEKLNDAYKKFMVRTMRRTKTVDDIRRRGEDDLLMVYGFTFADLSRVWVVDEEV